VLTARGQKLDKLNGLNVGPDDYVTKPFDREELIARIHAVLRRTRKVVTHLRLGTVLIDFETQHASSGETPLELSYREFALLRYLAERRNTVVQRHDLLQGVWGYPDSPETARSVDHAIARRRRKVEVDPHHPQSSRPHMPGDTS
jgi:DNA-binding response OmpR family regulator